MARAKMTEEAKLARYGEVIGSYESSSSPGTMYQVRCSPSGEVTCNCKGWIFHKKCWHLTAASNAIPLKTVAAAAVAAKKKAV